MHTVFRTILRIEIRESHLGILAQWPVCSIASLLLQALLRPCTQRKRKSRAWAEHCEQPSIHNQRAAQLCLMVAESLTEPLYAQAAAGLPAPWSGPTPVVMAHRAGGNEAPENTLAALRQAEAFGCRVMQMDVLPTLDGTPVVFHDINLNRATGVDRDIRKVSM